MTDPQQLECSTTKIRLKPVFYPPFESQSNNRSVIGHDWTDGIYNVETMRGDDGWWVHVNKGGECVFEHGVGSVKKARQAIVDALNKDCGESRYV